MYIGRFHCDTTLANPSQQLCYVIASPSRLARLTILVLLIATRRAEFGRSCCTAIHYIQVTVLLRLTPAASRGGHNEPAAKIQQLRQRQDIGPESTGPGPVSLRLLQSQHGFTDKLMVDNKLGLYKLLLGVETSNSYYAHDWWQNFWLRMLCYECCETCRRWNQLMSSTAPWNGPWTSASMVTCQVHYRSRDHSIVLSTSLPAILCYCINILIWNRAAVILWKLLICKNCTQTKICSLLCDESASESWS